MKPNCASRAFVHVPFAAGIEVEFQRWTAASAISAIEPDPSLHSVCICRSPRGFPSHAGFRARTSRAFDNVKNPRRISGCGPGSFGGFSIYPRMTFSRYGPTPGKSVSERPSLKMPAASSGHRKERREARRKALFRGERADSASMASSSAMLLLVSGVRAFTEGLSLAFFWLIARYGGRGLRFRNGALARK